MIIQGAPYMFLSNTVSTKNVGIALCIIILMILLATILVCVLFAPPSLLTVSFEMIFILTFFVLRH